MNNDKEPTVVIDLDKIAHSALMIASILTVVLLVPLICATSIDIENEFTCTSPLATELAVGEGTFNQPEAQNHGLVRD